MSVLRASANFRPMLAKLGNQWQHRVTADKLLAEGWPKLAVKHEHDSTYALGSAFSRNVGVCWRRLSTESARCVLFEEFVAASAALPSRNV